MTATDTTQLALRLEKFYKELESVSAVEPKIKKTAIWGDIKKKLRHRKIRQARGLAPIVKSANRDREERKNRQLAKKRSDKSVTTKTFRAKVILSDD